MVMASPAVLNALTLNWNRQRADLDDQENRYRINYNSALDKLSRGYQDATTRNAEGFADRGLTQSGPALATGVKLQEDYNRQGAQGAQALNTNLATLARKRLEANQQYDTEKLLASLGFTTK